MKRYSVYGEGFTYTRQDEHGKYVLYDDCSIPLRDIESFCEGRIKIGIMVDAYRDVLFLVRQHLKKST